MHVKFDINEIILMNAMHRKKSLNCIITATGAASRNASDLYSRCTLLETR
jgi:hypothetical protein